MEPVDIRDTVFKGVTRPAMWMGIPYIPLLCVTGFILWSTTWTSLYAIAALPPVLIGMSAVTKKDDQQWRLFFLWFYMRVVNFNATRRHWGASTYAPTRLEKR